MLWLFDNESGLIAGYSLLNSEKVSKDGNTVRRSMNGKMFQAFHQKMLETNCIFRKRTVKRLYALYKSPKSVSTASIFCINKRASIQKKIADYTQNFFLYAELQKSSTYALEMDKAMSIKQQ